MSSQSVSVMKVSQPGPYATLQDRGRVGGEPMGVGSSGALDTHSYAWANRLCSNSTNSACIEITAGMFEAQVLRETVVALTGAHATFCIDGNPHATWQSHRVKKGQVISVAPPDAGFRNYLAISGGFTGPEILGSVSTNRRERLGGHKGDGSVISAGDVLQGVALNNTPKTLLRAPEQVIPSFPDKIILRLVKGYQFDSFPSSSIRTLLFNDYAVSNKSDRMGIRLSGSAVTPPTSPLFSEGICFGAVQVPADGQPIIMLSDRQTIGGYHKLGSILRSDANALAQAKPGDSVSFDIIDVLDAQAHLQLEKYRFDHTMPLSVN
ncbi:biotin-dependent carboxyltransferase family protein [Aestuariibacter salexigens]|uniref:5-oxoprolinase subunit C family protein n=1 Tax=Aestuariibacter salexigens TaxID=226010 RepID=UPI0003FCD49B|nr:biotin-dependent carboxyltransferase family protein [Aestuariibacter salexigens]